MHPRKDRAEKTTPCETATERLGALHANGQHRAAYAELERLLEQSPVPVGAYRFVAAILCEDGGSIVPICGSLARSTHDLRAGEYYRVRGGRHAETARERPDPRSRYSPERTFAICGALAVGIALAAVVISSEQIRDAHSSPQRSVFARRGEVPPHARPQLKPAPTKTTSAFTPTARGRIGLRFVLQARPAVSA